jgi:pSer/pThr/pTyr-binding forkhead associated (FHA) protein
MPTTASELKEQIEAERRGEPFIYWRDVEHDVQHLVTLGPDKDRLTVGRGEQNDIRLESDTQVSRVHAELERIGGDWTVADDGLSRNGTFLNGERVTGRKRLSDRDTIRFGETLATFRQPAEGSYDETHIAPDLPDAATLSDMQRKILIALCRPFKDSTSYATPATNQQIASEVYLSVDAVKAHLRVLFAKFDVGDLPQNQKRVRLVELAFKSGAISIRDL